MMRDAAPPVPVAPQNGFFVRHGVALVSLFVALTALGYNTWRNETTEQHRNTRQAAFVMLEEAGRLQQLVDQRFFAAQRNETSRIAAWGKVALLRDLGPLVSPRTGDAAQALLEAWRARLAELDTGSAEAEQAISGAIAALREQVLADLVALR